jgi:hypothetical protein
MQILGYSCRFKVNWAVAIVFFLAGCASTHENDKENYQQAIAEAEATYEKLLDGQPILYLLESKIRMPPQKDWTSKQLSDHSFANESQKEAITVYDRITTESNATLMEMAKKLETPGEAAIFADWMKASKENRLALLEERISFGVFNQNCKTLDEAMQSLSKNLGKETAEKAHAAWVYAFNAWGESLKWNKPVAANCDRAGDALQCTGNQAP